MPLSKQEHHERAKDDARTSNEFGRGAAQATILINGGAATAILAFLSSVIRDGGSTAKSILPLIPVALVAYALGVFLGAIALAVGSRSIERWMEFHEGDEGKAGVADRLWRTTLWLIGLGLVCFLVASVYLAYGIGSIQIAGT